MITRRTPFLLSGYAQTTPTSGYMHRANDNRNRDRRGDVEDETTSVYIDIHVLYTARNLSSASRCGASFVNKSASCAWQ